MSSVASSRASFLIPKSQTIRKYETGERECLREGVFGLVAITSTMSDLAAKTCVFLAVEAVPHAKGRSRRTRKKPQVDGWNVSKHTNHEGLNVSRLSRSPPSSFKSRLVDAGGEQWHHPEFSLAWGKSRDHGPDAPSINGPEGRSDSFVAAKIDQLLQTLKLRDLHQPAYRPPRVAVFVQS